eukprot:m.44309 g.44309  ORF g.44309 m.44309 type:complete len:808 (+) comp33513_c0_seq7:85-2508(+)
MSRRRGDDPAEFHDQDLINSISPSRLLKSRLPGSPPPQTDRKSEEPVSHRPPRPRHHSPRGDGPSSSREPPNNRNQRSILKNSVRREWLRPEPAQLQTNAVRDSHRMSAAYASSSGDSLDTVVARQASSPPRSQFYSSESDFSAFPPSRVKGWTNPPPYGDRSDGRRRLPVRAGSFHGMEDRIRQRSADLQRRSWQPGSRASAGVRLTTAELVSSSPPPPPPQPPQPLPASSPPYYETRSPPSHLPRRSSLTRMYDEQAESEKSSPVAQEMDDDRTWKSRLWPPKGYIAWSLTRIMVLLLCYGAAWAILGSLVLPCSHGFSVILLVVLAAFGGFLARIVFLPPLVGMLIAGFLFGNIPLLVDSSEKGSCSNEASNSSNSSNSTNITSPVCGHCFCLNQAWSSALRSVALVVILSRAGLGLNPSALKRLKYVVMRLAFLPCLAEALVFAIVSHFLLDMPWAWSFTAGFVVAAVSPAVVVPGLLSLQKRKYGVAKGIPTMVIAAASVDDVLAISGFGISLGLAFSEGNLIFNIFRGPLELVLGLGGGILIGVVSWLFPSKDMSSGFKARNRLIYLLACGLFAVFGSRRVHFTGAGALGVLVASFVCAYGWKEDKAVIAECYNIMWQIAQPMLFGLIGAAVEINCLSGSVVGLAIACMLIAVIIRVGVSYLAIYGQGFTRREKIFVGLAWLPKATVQAAVGSIAYDTALERNNSTQEEIDLGRKVLIIAFLVIVCSAPLGAAAIMFSGPKLLQRQTDGEDSVSEGSKGREPPIIRLAVENDEEMDVFGADDGEGAGEADVQKTDMNESNV